MSSPIQTTKHTIETKQQKHKRSVWELIVSTVAGIGSGVAAAGSTIRKEFWDEAKMRPGFADFIVTADQAAKYEKTPENPKGFNVIQRFSTAPLHDKAYIPSKDADLIISTEDSVAQAVAKSTEASAGGWVKFRGILNEHHKSLHKADAEFRHKPGGWKAHAEDIYDLKRKFGIRRIQLLEEEYGITSGGIKGLFKGTFSQFPSFLGVGTRGEVLFKGISVASIVGVGAYNLLTSMATRDKTRQIEDILLTPNAEKSEAIAALKVKSLNDNVPGAQVHSIASDGVLIAAQRDTARS